MVGHLLARRFLPAHDRLRAGARLRRRGGDEGRAHARGFHQVPALPLALLRTHRPPQLAQPDASIRSRGGGPRVRDPRLRRGAELHRGRRTAGENPRPRPLRECRVFLSGPADAARRHASTRRPARPSPWSAPPARARPPCFRCSRVFTKPPPAPSPSTASPSTRWPSPRCANTSPTSPRKRSSSTAPCAKTSCSPSATPPMPNCGPR